MTFRRSPSDQKEKYFQLFISKRLLQTAQLAKNIHADATQKVTTEKLPLIVIGSTDMSQSFHLAGLTITSHENTAAYKMSFDALQSGIQRVTGNKIEPRALICDADPAIHNGFKLSFDSEAPIIMCYVHVLRNVDSKYKFNDKNNKPQILDDLRILYQSGDQRTFQIGCELFIKKWCLEEKNVVETIQKTFFEKNYNWYIGSCFRTPKTNNALESFNGNFKKLQNRVSKGATKTFFKNSHENCTPTI